MAIIPNLRRNHPHETAPTLTASQPNDGTGKIEALLEASVQIARCSQAYVETPQLMLTDWIDQCGGPKKPLGSVPSTLRVGIIGGGCSGVTAALEAVKAGATTTLIEARSEVGGRARSVVMGPKDIGEQGCMRFPPSEAVLYTLAAAFGYGFINNFPDPGVVPTLICYAGRTQLWTDHNTLPEGFEKVTKGWNELVKSGFVIKGKKFASAANMATSLKSIDRNTREKVVQKWQQYIDEFKNDTFLHGLKKIFSTSNDKPPGGKNWTDGDVDRFGKLGIGSGGFGAFFNAGFLTVMRFVVNSWETDQARFVKVVPNERPTPAGIRALWQSILDWTREANKEEKDFGTLTTLLNTKAKVVSKSADSIYTVTVENPCGKIEYHEFDELFINVTTNVANFDLDLARRGDGQIFPDATCDAIKTLHMALTTKLFIKVDRAPFNDRDFPRALLTDGDLPQLYCLDYGDDDTMVVLVVYAWEDYSARLQAEKDPKKLFEHLKELAAQAVSKSEYPKWAECLKPVDEIKLQYLQHWQDDSTARGAFTFAEPSQDHLCAALFYDFEKGEGPYLIGDSFSFGGGWIESGLETTYTCFSAMLKRRQETFGDTELYNPEFAPVNLLSSKTYTY